MKKGGADKRNPVRPGALDSVILGVPVAITECSIIAENGSGSCFDEHSSKVILSAYNSATIEEAKNVSGCDSERCLVENARPKIGRQANAILHNNFKIDGPTNSELLSNIDIDSVLAQWSRKWKDFYAYNFNMLNYASYRYSGGDIVPEPDTLATIKFETLYKDGFRCAACVINSDVYQGGGKHWMALFVDARDPTNNAATVEFFNSSGRPPVAEWVNFMVKTQIGLQNLGFKQIELINCCSIEHQKSMSECGVYSLYYIWCRLNGVPAKSFKQGKPISDAIMFEFRQHLFAKPIASDGGKFNWDEYQKTVKIKWV